MSQKATINIESAYSRQSSLKFYAVDKKDKSEERVDELVLARASEIVIELFIAIA